MKKTTTTIKLQTIDGGHLGMAIIWLVLFIFSLATDMGESVLNVIFGLLIIFCFGYAFVQEMKEAFKVK